MRALVLTLIYRNIIKKDVLEKILDRSIYQRYMTDPTLPRDRAKGIPLEFTLGAFRFGHAIVRDTYDVNSTAKDQPTIAALRLSALFAHQELLPLKALACRLGPLLRQQQGMCPISAGVSGRAIQGPGKPSDPFPGQG